LLWSSSAVCHKTRYNYCWPITKTLNNTTSLNQKKTWLHVWFFILSCTTNMWLHHLLLWTQISILMGCCDHHRNW
jgi:hypothetical protein